MLVGAFGCGLSGDSRMIVDSGFAAVDAARLAALDFDGAIALRCRDLCSPGAAAANVAAKQSLIRSRRFIRDRRGHWSLDSNRCRQLRFTCGFSCS